VGELLKYLSRVSLRAGADGSNSSLLVGFTEVMSSNRNSIDHGRIRVAQKGTTLLAVTVAACAACVEKAGTRPPPSPPVALPVEVALETQHQTIAGFGASSAWTASSLTDAEADQFFSPDTGIGLSLLRVRIAPDGTTEELAAESAVARGVSVWATPWSPPGEWKDNGSTNNGGHLLSTEAQAWADRLADFAQGMANSGVTLSALSAQNEPGFSANWETCLYTAAQLTAFIRDNLGPALATRGLATPIIAPESQNWKDFPKFADAILADPVASTYVGMLATHDYGGTPAVYSANGKQVWQTEVSDPNKGVDPGIDSGLRVAQKIHDHLVNADVSAWHYWWLKPRGDQPADNSALTGLDGQLTRRGYVLGNWSRFVRPGFVRVEATPNPQDQVSVSAFADPASGRLVIVAINQGTEDAEQIFSIPGTGVTVVTPWITSADFALVPAAAMPLTDTNFTFTLPGRSVTTLVGDP